MKTTTSNNNTNFSTEKSGSNRSFRNTTRNSVIVAHTEFKYVNLIRAAAMYKVVKLLVDFTDNLSEFEFDRLLDDNIKVKAFFQRKVTLAHALSFKKVFGHTISPFYRQMCADMKLNPKVFLGVPVTELPSAGNGYMILALYAFLGMLPVWDMFCFTTVTLFTQHGGLHIVSSDWFQEYHGRSLCDADRVLTSLYQYEEKSPSVDDMIAIMLQDGYDHLTKLAVFNEYAYSKGVYPYPSPDTYGHYGVISDRLFDPEQCVTEHIAVSTNYEDQCFNTLEVELDDTTIVNVEVVHPIEEKEAEVLTEPEIVVNEDFVDIAVDATPDLGGMSASSVDSDIELLPLSKPRPARLRRQSISFSKGCQEVERTEVANKKRYRKTSVLGPNKYNALLCVALCLAHVSGQSTNSSYFRCYDIPSMKYTACPDDTETPGHVRYEPYPGGVALFDEGGVSGNIACVGGNAITALLNRPPEYSAACTSHGDCMIKNFRYCYDPAEPPADDTCSEKFIRYGDDEAPRETAISNYTVKVIGNDTMLYVPSAYKRGMYGAGVFCDGGKLLGVVTSVDFANKGLIVQNFTMF